MICKKSEIATLIIVILQTLRLKKKLGVTFGINF